jgi:hypothetical protein
VPAGAYAVRRPLGRVWGFTLWVLMMLLLAVLLLLLAAA